MMPPTLSPSRSATCKPRRSDHVLAHSTVSRSANRNAQRRLDDAVVAAGLVENRSRAQALILAGAVLLDGEPTTRAGAQVRSGSIISLKEPPRFVSRGGEKLAHALYMFGIEVAGLVAADFGASTGGFTDALLQAGAARVYAIDV